MYSRFGSGITARNRPGTIDYHEGCHVRAHPQAGSEAPMWFLVGFLFGAVSVILAGFMLLPWAERPREPTSVP
jgi:hypothetical protein